MKTIEKNLWYGGKSGAVTFSYDDGRIEDIRLVETFNKYGVKGTFHLCNPDFLNCFDFLEGVTIVDPETYGELYKGHEVSCHSKHHPFLHELPDEKVRSEISENKEFLENLCGYTVRGMSYPFGSFDDRVIELCREEGMEYSRTVADTHDFDLPENFMMWHPTCHHVEADKALADRFAESKKPLKLLYVWGHSYEFYDEEKWEKLESFLSEISGREDTWYATNIEILDYVSALDALEISEEKIYNPSDIDLWVTVDGEAAKIGAKQEIK
ncbi:MAG: polysaccharide deacetylase [Ruminococcaceae bacterium]|nr:polysaccharide deacetylase [Oscillospiraceae bacterium]